MAADELTRPPEPVSDRKARRLTLLAILAPPLAMVVGLAIYFIFSSDPDNEPDAGPDAGRKIESTVPDQTGSIEPASIAVVTRLSLRDGSIETGQFEEVAADVVISDPSKPSQIRLAAARRDDLIDRSEYRPEPTEASR